MRALFILVSLALMAGAAFAQSEIKPGSASIGSVEGEDGSSSLQGTFKYQVPLGEIFDSSFDPVRSRGSLFDITPDVFLNLSEGPNLNSVVVKVTGNYMRFSVVDIEGVYTPDSASYFSVFPISLGFEADQSFDNVVAVAEFGYVPFRLAPIGNSNFKLGVNPRVGVFAQFGYKFGAGSSSGSGASADQSSEPRDSEIARLKASADISIPLFSFGKTRPSPVSILVSAEAWYDLLNNEVYDREELIFRVGLGEGANLDFKYEHGSGAPNFNEGEQFGVFLNTTF